MHDYSIDRHPKQKVIFGLAFLAIVAAPYVNGWFGQIMQEGPAFLKTPAMTAIPVFTLYSLLYWLFNTYLWKFPPLRRGLLVPDLNGVWHCSGVMLRKEGAECRVEWDAQVHIVQSWSKIGVHLRKEGSSRSQSISASISREPGLGFRLLYHYMNEPDVAQPALHRHGGTATVLFDNDCMKADGSYFTDHARGTVGEMHFKRVEK